MNAPIIWILLPIIAGISLFFLRRNYRLAVSLSTGLALLLVLLARWLPINETIHVGSWALKISETLNVLGRQFTLTNNERPLLLCIYLLAAVWFAVAYITRAGQAFAPLGLIITGLLTAVIAVNPFLYAAMLVEMTALVSVVLLSRPGYPTRHGPLRFIIFQTLGMPCILFTGRLLTGVEASPGDLELVNQAAILLGLGFTLWLAIFPFHTWLPMVSEEAHPLAAGFVLLIMPWVVMLFGLGFLDRYAWLRNAPQLGNLLQLGGILMVLTGGIWAAFQRDLSRMLGYAVMVEIGKALLAISLPNGLQLFFAMLLPRAVAMAVWSLALSILQITNEQLNRRDLRYPNVRGLAYQLPLATIALSIAHFSVAGLPLTAGFPVFIALIRQLAPSSILAAGCTLLGTMGLFAGGLRSLAVLVTASGTESPVWRIQERGATIIFLVIGIIAIIVIGLFPQVFLPPLSELAQIFTHLYLNP